MALRKEPAARYASVEQFAEDIRRYLAGLPTTARRGTFGYRAVKYVRRNRVPLAAAALVALSLCGGTVATARQARFALAAQVRAEREQANADAQRLRAETALTTAEERRQQAEAARNEADLQRNEAEVQRVMAEEQRAFADTQRGRAETQELSSRRLLYTSRMGLAMQAWRDANVGRMLDLLSPYLPLASSEASAPDFRGFEWRYLWNLSHQVAQTWPLQGGVSSDGLAFSVDGRHLLTLHQRREGTPPVNTSEMLYRDVATGQIQQTVKLPYATMGAFSRDRQTLALAQFGAREIILVALPSGAEMRRITGWPGRLMCLDVTPDGKQIVAGFQDGSLGLYDVMTGREVYRFKRHADRVATLAIAPDGRQFVSGGDDRTARLWDVATGKEILLLSQKINYPQSSRFSPDGQKVVVSGSGQTTAWVASSGIELVVLADKGKQMAFTPDSQTLLIGGEDAERQAEISLIDTATWQTKGVLRGHGHWIMALAVSPDGRFLVSGSGDLTTKLWDLTRTRDFAALTDHRRFGEFTHAAVSPDGQRLLTASAKQNASVWDIATHREIALLQGHTPPPNSYPFKLLVAISPDNRWYATGSGVDGEVKIWDAATCKESDSFKAATAVRLLAFAPDSSTLAVGGVSQVELRERHNGKLLATLDTQQSTVSGLSFSADGQHLYITGATSTVQIWDTATKLRRQEFRLGESSILSFALAPDERFFATAHVDGARLWEAQSGKLTAVFKGHSSAVFAVAFSPDGRRLATGSREPFNNVKLWDLATGEELLALNDIRSWIVDHSLGFSADGQFLFAAGWNRSVHFWRAAPAPALVSMR